MSAVDVLVCGNCNGTGVFDNLCGDRYPCICQTEMIDASRARFEAWQSQRYLAPGLFDRDENGHGKYIHPLIEGKWCVWQAAAQIDRDDVACIAIYDAVSLSCLTRDVKTPERKAAIVRAALVACKGETA